MLFLDEFTEFRRDAVKVVVTRMVGSVAFPSRFTLVAANPCPCGFEGDPVPTGSPSV